MIPTLERFRRSGRLRALYGGIRAFVLGPPPGTSSAAARPEVVEDGVRELHRVTPTISQVDGYRLNLVIPTVAPAGAFGGIRTALDLFEAIAPAAPARRIVSMAALPADAASVLPGYRPTPGAEDSTEPAQLVSIDPATDPTLAVGPRDVFVATFWSTAELADRLRRWQATTFGHMPDRWAYVIQDHEPGFYPKSAHSELARATYLRPESTVAIFNTSLLQGAFHARGLRFDREFAFEPRIPEPLRATLAVPPGPRDRTIVVYGRPRTPRNAFPAIVDGLRAWRAGDPEAATWSVVSAGMPHPDIDLGDGVWLRSVGKLDLVEYAQLLRRSAIGISLMISPHPSYPPIEMAHLGLLVLTNSHENKDLSSWHSNIASTDDLSADGLAERLSELCRRFDAEPGSGDLGVSSVPEYLSDGPQFPFAAEVSALLRPDAAVGPR